MKPQLDAFEILVQSAPGTSGWHWILSNPTPKITKGVLSRPEQPGLTPGYEPKFLLKMAPGASRQLGDSVPMVVKAGVFIAKVGSSSVAPVYVLFQFGGSDRIYQVWIDSHAGDDLPSPLYRLQEMPYLSFLLIEERSQPERVINIENKIDWAKLTAKVETVPAWNKAAFQAAKVTAPSVRELWEKKIEQTEASEAIALLNDRFRKGDRSLGEYKLSRQILALPKHKQKQLFKDLHEFSDFNYENDPGGERKQGAIAMDGVTYIWKIDYLDLSMTMLSEDPSDANQTTRILSLIRKDETSF
ncbi:MAG: DUF3768 domain-containing protein [Cyanobacteriota bacterium]|nr:DUF3768 domain-containing protein [Cyanobacteriota bacterium]